MDDAIDPSALNVLIQPVVFDHRPKVRTGAHPVALLNDPAVHVTKVKAPVRPRLGIDGPKVGIAAAQEFCAWGGIVHYQFTILIHNLCTTH